MSWIQDGSWCRLPGNDSIWYWWWLWGLLVIVDLVPFFTTILFGKLFFRWCHAGFFLFSISAKKLFWSMKHRWNQQISGQGLWYPVQIWCIHACFFLQWPWELKSLNWTRIATFENAVRPVSKLQEVSGTKKWWWSIFSTFFLKTGRVT